TSGGILTTWDSNVFSKEIEFIDRNFVGVIGFYVPQANHLKEVLWSHIQALLENVNASWIVFSDFDVVRFQEERSGSRFNFYEANSFNDFMSRCGLVDFLFGGMKFSRVESKNRHRWELNNKFLAWDEKAEDGVINEHDILKRWEWIMDLLQIDRLRNEDMKQKCTWVEAPSDIKQAAMDHYEARFKESSGNRPMLASNIFRKLSTTE
nr:hypothetical protein [Tanacetum cinerariifolium]